MSLSVTKEKQCLACLQTFSYLRSTAKYCSAACKDHRHNGIKAKQHAARRVRRKLEVTPITNAFIQYLIRECIDAGTVQILQGSTVDDLKSLHEMTKIQRAFNADIFNCEPGTLRQYQLHLCHVFPSKGRNGVGKLNARNIVLGESQPNRRHGTRYLGHGDCIAPFELDSRFAVSPCTSHEIILKKIATCVGAKVWEEFTKAVKLRPSTRQKAFDALEILLDPTNPDHAGYIEAAKDPRTTTTALSRIVRAIKDQKEFHISTHTDYQLSEIYIDQLVRMAAFRPELCESSSRLKALEVSCREVGGRSLVFSEDDLQLMFDVLHGADASHIDTDRIVAEYTVEPKRSIPAYLAPVVDLEAYRKKACRMALIGQRLRAKESVGPELIADSAIPF